MRRLCIFSALCIWLLATPRLATAADSRERDQGAIPIVVGNSLEGRSHGAELVLNVQPLTWWRTHVGYTWLDSSIVRPPGSRDVGGGVSEMNDPRHFVGVRTSLDLPGNVEFDAQLRSVASLPNPTVPAYPRRVEFERSLRVGLALRIPR